MPILRLAIPSPLRAEFDYLPPTDMDERRLGELKPGIRIRVSFGRRELVGYLMAIVPNSSVDADKLKPALEILDPSPLISESMLALCEWAAAYYQHPVGEVVPTAFPPGLRKGRPHQPSGIPGWRLTTQGKGLPRGAMGRSPKQAAALEMLQQHDVVTTAAFTENSVSGAILRTLQSKGLIQAKLSKLVLTKAKCHGGLALNSDQSAAVDELISHLGTFGVHLLEGVTGSGKTEVYLQLIAQCLQLGQQVLVLIPEIGLTPQTRRRFESRFSGKLVSLHSGMADGARQRGWEAARDGSAHIILGTRSAIFTPINNLGLIVVDEEHDGSYKQQDGFRYSARDIAVKRAQLENCPVLLGSATPSLESIYNAREGR